MMIIPALLAFLHFACVFIIVATICLQYFTLSQRPTLREAIRLQIADRWYGAAAAMVLIAGVLRVMYFEKGPQFYLAQPWLWVKMAAFLTLGLLSIYPTVVFFRWGPATAQGQAPTLGDTQFLRLMRILRLEIYLLLLVALAASLMARAVRM